MDTLVILPIWSTGEVKIDIDLKGAFSRYNPIMADRITRQDGAVLIFKDGNIIHKFNSGLITAFGAGDITYSDKRILEFIL